MSEFPPSKRDSDDNLFHEGNVNSLLIRVRSPWLLRHMALPGESLSFKFSLSLLVVFRSVNAVLNPRSHPRQQTNATRHATLAREQGSKTAHTYLVMIHHVRPENDMRKEHRIP